MSIAAPVHRARCQQVLLLSYMHGEGGIQTHTRYLARGLIERGHSVRIVSPSPMEQHSQVRNPQNPAGFETYDSLWDAIRVVRREPCDIAVVTGTGWKAMSAVALLPRHCRKVFFEVMSGARSEGADPRTLVHLGFDAVVGQAHPVEQRFCNAFSWKGRSTTIPALPEPLELDHDIPLLRTKALGLGAPLRFAFFSRLAPHKHADLLIEHWDKFAPAGSVLDIWGTGPESQRLAHMVRQRSLEQAIALRGRYPSGAAYINLLQSYDLLMLPTVGDEGAPLVLLEAMACGLPFVANGVGGIPDYANADCAITGGAISEFVPAVRKMIERLQKGEVDPTRLQEHYKVNYGFERLVSRWEDFLTACATRNKAPLRRNW